MDAENLIKQATALRRLLLDRIQLVETNRAKMMQLDVAGRIYATPHWRDGRYLYLLHPGKGDGQRGVREYIGAKKDAVHQALTKTWNAKNYDKLEMRNQKISNLLMRIEREIEAMNRDLERLGPVDLATQGNGDFGDVEGSARAELVTNSMQSDMVTGSAHQVRSYSPKRGLDMTDNVENLIIEHLKALRNQIEDTRAEMREEFQEIKHRLTSIETTTVRGRSDTVHQQEDIYRQQAALDRIKERIERIERRLELS